MPDRFPLSCDLPALRRGFEPERLAARATNTTVSVANPEGQARKFCRSRGEDRGGGRGEGSSPHLTENPRSSGPGSSNPGPLNSRSSSTQSPQDQSRSQRPAERRVVISVLPGKRYARKLSEPALVRHRALGAHDYPVRGGVQRSPEWEKSSFGRGLGTELPYTAPGQCLSTIIWLGTSGGRRGAATVEFSAFPIDFAPDMEHVGGDRQKRDAVGCDDVAIHAERSPRPPTRALAERRCSSRSASSHARSARRFSSCQRRTNR